MLARVPSLPGDQENPEKLKYVIPIGRELGIVFKLP